jgi:hypothetical protein
MFTCPDPNVVALQIAAVTQRPNSDEHICNAKTCIIRHLPVEIHALDSRFFIVCKFIKPVPGLHPQNTLHQKVSSIFCCQNTGKIHYCHANCNGEKILCESIETCCITGMQFSSEQVRTYGVANRVQTSMTADKSDPLKYSRETNGTLSKTSGVHNMKIEQCKLIAKNILHSFLFSITRENSELHKLTELRRDAEKLVNKYKRHSEKNNRPKNYIQMITIYLNQMRKRPSRLEFLEKTQREQDFLIFKYTKELIGTWKMILYKTEQGKTSPSQFNFKIFVPACLYIMKNGVTMNGQLIIRRSQFLSTCLPETNTLDLYAISKTPFTASKNNIMAAIRETIGSSVEKAVELYQYAQSESKKVHI